MVFCRRMTHEHTLRGLKQLPLIVSCPVGEEARKSSTEFPAVSHAWEVRVSAGLSLFLDSLGRTLLPGPSRLLSGCSSLRLEGGRLLSLQASDGGCPRPPGVMHVPCHLAFFILEAEIERLCLRCLSLQTFSSGESSIPFKGLSD